MTTNTISLDRIVQRGKEVATFNTRTYQEIARDPGATAEAAIIVAVIAVSSGLGRLFAGPTALIGSIIAMLLGWVVAGAVVYFVGTKITGAAESGSSVERVLRTVGYAAVPNVFMFLTGIWGIGWLVAMILFFWTLVTIILAIRASLGTTVSQAVITGIVAWFVSLIVMGILGAIFGINISVPF